MSEPTILVLASEADPEPREDVAAALVAAAEAAGLGVKRIGPSERPAVDGETIAFALDAGALAAAPADAFRVAVLPAYGVGWRDPAADAVFVAHEAIVSRLDPAARRRAHVVGPIAPPGFAAEVEDGDQPDGGRPDGGLEGAVVVILPSVVLEVGPTPLFVQLSLVGEPATYLFDVGRDAEIADALRTFATGHLGEESRAGLFASEEQARLYRRADVVVGTGADPALAAALAAGTGLVVVDPGLGAEALAADEAVVVAGGPSMLSVALDEALGRGEAMAAAARKRDAAGGAERALAKARELAAGRGDEARPEGLPRGIEWLSLDGVPRPRAEAAGGAEDGASDAPDAESFEDRIERELAALKKQLE